MAILGDGYVITPTEAKDFASFNQQGISLEICHSTNLVEEVNITEFNYDSLCIRDRSTRPAPTHIWSYPQ